MRAFLWVKIIMWLTPALLALAQQSIDLFLSDKKKHHFLYRK